MVERKHEIRTDLHFIVKFHAEKHGIVRQTHFRIGIDGVQELLSAETEPLAFELVQEHETYFMRTPVRKHFSSVFPLGIQVVGENRQVQTDSLLLKTVKAVHHPVKRLGIQFHVFL